MAYELKTQLNDADVKAFINGIVDEQQKEDCLVLLDIFTSISGEDPKMWWETIVWFGTYSYTNSTWKEYTWMRTAFAPRKNALSVYIMPGYDMGMEGLVEKLGKYKAGKSCLNIKKLSDIDLKVLEKIIKKWLDIMANKYPS